MNMTYLEIKRLKAKYTNNQLRDMYLDYVNNYITVNTFSIDNDLTIKKALQVVSLGKSIHKANLLLNS